MYAAGVRATAMEFFEAPAFTRHVANYMTPDEYRELQNELARNPGAGDVMPGTGAFRKLRWADPRHGKGRRGGLRSSITFLRPTIKSG